MQIDKYNEKGSTSLLDILSERRQLDIYLSGKEHSS